MKKNYTFKLTTAVALLFCLGIQNVAIGQTTATINVSEDTYVDGSSSTADTNFGTASEGRARDTTTTAPRLTYYKFPITAGLPSSVTSAKLTFHTYLPSTAGTTEILQIHKVASSWAENTITYNTGKPVTGALIGEVNIESVQVASPNDYSKSYTIDVTAYFNQAKAAGATNISFAIEAKPKDIGGNSNNVRLGTRESVGGASSIEIKYTSLGVNDFNANSLDLKVYPNPISSNFTISCSFDVSDEVEVAVCNVLGQKVAGFKENVDAGSWNKDLSVGELNLKSGIYFIRVSSTANGNSVSKVVVK